MLKILFAIVAAVIVFVPCAFVGTIVGYRVVKWCGVTDMEGKSGFYAFFFGGVPAGILGAWWAGWAVVQYA